MIIYMYIYIYYFSEKIYRRCGVINRAQINSIKNVIEITREKWLEFHKQKVVIAVISSKIVLAKLFFY